jgi:hypothetical protein
VSLSGRPACGRSGISQSWDCGFPPRRLGGDREDAGLTARDREYMLHEHPGPLRRIPEVHKPSAVRRFVDAVLALSDDPRPDNVERYLLASRALEDSSSRTSEVTLSVGGMAVDEDRAAA